MNLSWNYCQSNSEGVLAEGIYCLRNSSKKEPCYNAGNYLILHFGKPYYIGEAENVAKRLKTQFSLTSSTFYKNYLKYSALDSEHLGINEFQANFIETLIGRKEIEDFGIVNLPTILNKFQKGKREKRAIARNFEIWGGIQENSREIFSEGEELFFSQNTTSWQSANIMPKPGVYRVLDADMRLIYIGESSNVEIRYMTHSKDTYFSALRRHIATEILEFELINKRKLTKRNDDLVNKYLSECNIAYMNVSFGRYEFEKYLIRKYAPVLNKKDNLGNSL
jgi:predicted GIY-YIG superfamily endonuclease